MIENNIYHSISERTGGAILLGIVGPVRTGKSTFVKQFMENLVLPRIENSFVRERARDELPQSGSGRAIMTAEPKFVPEEAIQVNLGEGDDISVRLVDCVGYMVEGAGGLMEDGQERMVTTPWFDHEVTMSEAAEKGTEKVIREHSTIGIVVTTDGSICDIPRSAYEPAEERVIRELQSIGKPFVVLLNCADPESAQAKSLAMEIDEKYAVRCIRVNCLRLDEEAFSRILLSALREFPLSSLGFYLPDWLDAMDDEEPLKRELFELLKKYSEKAEKLRDADEIISSLSTWELAEGVEKLRTDLGKGEITAQIKMPRALFYQMIREKTGVAVENDGELIRTLTELSGVDREYRRIRQALEDVRSKGYGVVIPESDEMTLAEPQIVRQGGKYSVRLRASAPAIHMLMTQVETEVSPAIGGEGASEDIISFLLQGFDGDVNRIWESNIFGKPLNQLAEEGLSTKLESLPENTREKLRQVMQRMVNENCSTLLCILI